MNKRYGIYPQCAPLPLKVTKQSTGDYLVKVIRQAVYLLQALWRTRVLIQKRKKELLHQPKAQIH